MRVAYLAMLIQQKCPQRSAVVNLGGQKPVVDRPQDSDREESADHELYVLSQEKCLDIELKTSTNLEAPKCQFRQGKVNDPK